MLIFLVFGGVFIAGYVGFIKCLFSMMQPDMAFDAISNKRWSKMLDRWYNKSNLGKLGVKAMGDCEQCTSFWWALPWSALYFIFCKSTGIWCIGVIPSVIWFLVFISICSYLGLKTLTHKQDVV